MVNFGGPESGHGVASRRCQSVQMQSDALASSELLPNLDGAVKSRFLMRVGWVIIVHVYFTRPTDRRIV